MSDDAIPSISSGLHNVVVKIGRPETLVAQWMEVLANNLFDDNLYQLTSVTSHDWAAMGLPVRVFVELRPLLQQLPKTLALSSVRRTESLEFSSSETTDDPNGSKSKLDIPKLDTSIPRQLPTTLKDEIKEAGVKKHQRRRSTNLSAAVVKHILEPVQQPEEPEKQKVTEYNVNIVGPLATPFIKTFLSPTNSANATKIYHIYDNFVRFKFTVCSDNAEIDCSAIIVIFSVVDLNQVSQIRESRNSYFPEGGIPTQPLIVIGVNTAKRETARSNGEKYISEKEGRLFAKDLQASLYIECTSVSDYSSVSASITSVGRIILNRLALLETPKASECISKIKKIVEQRSTDLNLRKKQIKFVPDQIFLSSSLKKICLSGNLIRFFPTELASVENLEELDLSINLIETLTGNHLIGFHKLVKLDLEGNKLEDLPLSQFEAMPNLTIIKVRNNPLSNISTKLHKRSNILEKPNRKTRGSKKLVPVFGSTLEARLEEDKIQNPHLVIPLVLNELIKFIVAKGLNIEGVFRESGKALILTKIKETLSISPTIQIPSDATPIEIASILKQYLRELAVPVFPFEQFHPLIQILSLPAEEQKGKFAEIIYSLPDVHKSTAYAVFHIMYLVALNKESNLMTIANLAKMLAPNILRQPASEAIDITTISYINFVIENIAENYVEIFEHKLRPFKYRTYASAQKSLAVLHRKVYAHKLAVAGHCYVQVEDRTLIWSSDTQGNCKVWDAETMLFVKSIDLGMKSVKGMVTVGKTVWVASLETIQIRDSLTGDLINSIENPRSFNHITDEEYVWSCSIMSITVHNAKDYTLRASVPLPSPPTAICKAKNEIWVASSDYWIRVIDSTTLEIKQEFQSTHERKITTLKYLGGTIWSSGDDGALCIWDTKCYCRIDQITSATATRINGFCFAGKLGISFSNSWDGCEVSIWDLESHRHLSDLQNFQLTTIASISSTFVQDLDCFVIHFCGRDGIITTCLIEGSRVLTDRKLSIDIKFPKGEGEDEDDDYTTFEISATPEHHPEKSPAMNKPERIKRVQSVQFGKDMLHPSQSQRVFIA